MKNENETEMEIQLNLEDGKITIDIFAYLRELPEEQRTELLWNHDYWGFVYPSLLKELREGFSRESYNADLHKFRVSLLTSDHAPQMIKEFVTTIIADSVQRIKYLQTWYNAMFNLYHHPALQDPEIHKIISGTMPPTQSFRIDASWAGDFIRQMLEANGIEFPETPDEYHIDR